MCFKSSFTIAAVAAISFCLIGGTTPAAADILHVPGDFPTIQAAIDAAMDRDEVEVHPGTYNENINLLGKSITVRSSDGAGVTTIDGGGTGATVITCANGEGPDTIIQGFTITGGEGTDLQYPGQQFNPVGGGMFCNSAGTTVLDCIFENNLLAFYGGGIFLINGSDASITNCTFTSNSAFSGAGILSVGSSPTITGCTFDGNCALDGEGGGISFSEGGRGVVSECEFTNNFSCFGAGIFTYQSSPTVTDCTFSFNFTKVIGGGMYNWDSTPVITRCTFESNTGNGILNTGSPAQISACIFRDNTSFETAGVQNADGSHATITSCVFLGNEGVICGGVANTRSSATIVNCLFVGNSSNNTGAIYNSSFNDVTTQPAVINCTVIGNTGPVAGGIRSRGGLVTTTIINSIVRDNSAAQIANSDGAVSIVSYSNVEGGFTGDGNIDQDPLFVDPGAGDYRLSSGSPSIDAGNNWGVAVDELDYDEDGVLCELFPVDLDGNPRFNADEADVDPGCGVPVVVDMGAYEYQFDPVDQVTFADLNGDDVVGVVDLLGLLGSWGPCAKGCCLANLDLDGNVGVSDLLALLANWGPCP